LATLQGCWLLAQLSEPFLAQFFSAGTKMRLAFDLDNTLIRNNYAFPLERPRWPRLARLLEEEGLRQGIMEAVVLCRAQGHEV
jgi:hypothetical protein